eukprot:11559970-Ditylum_brightwellii.AAC.1
MGNLPEPFYIWYMATLLIAANKCDTATLANIAPMDIHPINIGSALMHVFTKAYFAPLAMLDGAEGTMVASINIANGYNEIQCKSILEAVWECPDLCGTYLFFHKILSPCSYVRLGGRAHVITASFTCDEGVQQGAAKASFLFCA